MFYISEIQYTAPAEYKTELQEVIYTTLQKLRICFERVDTDEVISIEDCIPINRKLDMKMVKTLFLCNRQKTDFYLFITTADKPFRAKELSAVMDSLVTLAKRGDLHARRQAAAYVRNVEVDEEGTTALQKLFNEIGPAYADRNGGYTRVVKTRIRRGDAAPMAIVQFVK